MIHSIDTKEQTADILTTPLEPGLFCIFEEKVVQLVKRKYLSRGSVIKCIVTKN